MKNVYHFSQNRESIISMQRAALGSGPFGLRITHGLIGSPDWWKQIETKALPLHTVRGKITGYWPGQWGDGPAEFAIETEDGTRITEMCNMEPFDAKHQFTIGRLVELQFVVQELKTISPISGTTEARILISISFP